jgi:hypothetical protein
MPYLGDHLIVTFTFDEKVDTPKPRWSRNWKNYDTGAIKEELAKEDWLFEADSVLQESTRRQTYQYH